MKKINSILVTYNPDIFQLSILLNKIQYSQITIIDNYHSNTNYPKLQILAKEYKSKFIPLVNNTGIAHAQNVGIMEALKKESDFIIFFDQDSDPDENLLRDLYYAFKKLKSQETNTKIGILGPRYIDPRQNNPPPFLQFRGLKMYRCPCHDEEAVVPVDYLISSGSMISRSALEDIGGMRENLFIDYVDIEWGLRAKYKGYQNYGICGAKMNHSLGDNPKKFGNKQIPIHSPLRHYYHFRNAILLYRESWIPWNWKFIDGYRLILKFIYYSIFTDKPWQHFKMMSLGIYHGLCNISGPYTK